MTPAEAVAAEKKTAGQTGKMVCRMRDRRHALGLSLEDVAKAIGCTRMNLSLIERGASTTLTTARKLAEFFGTTLDDLWPPTP